jgi:hypothetical protein
MTIEPIKTTYSGTQFKSRLEARWALFMDMSGFPWKYEPKGENTPPDFLVNDDFYMEVKGTLVSPEYIDFLRRQDCYLLAIGGFFNKKLPLLLEITSNGIVSVNFFDVFEHPAQFKKACEHRFDLKG